MDKVARSPDFMSTEQNRYLSQVVRDLGQRVMRFIRVRVQSESDAQDILQEVWQQLATTVQGGPIEQVAGWLFTVARNRIIDRARKPRMDSLDALTDGEDSLDLAEYLLRDDQTPQTEHVRGMFWERLHAALAELPEEQRQVFVWHELEALSYQDIAELTGANVNTLISRKRYAVLHLRKRLEPLRQEFNFDQL